MLLSWVVLIMTIIGGMDHKKSLCLDYAMVGARLSLDNLPDITS